MLPSLLFLILACMAFIGSILLISVSRMMQSVTLNWWGAAYFVSAFGVAIIALAARSFPWMSYGLGPALVLVAYGMMWVGLRRLSHERVQVVWPFLLGLVWALLCLIPPLNQSELVRFVIFSPIAFCCMIAIALECTAAPGRLGARIPLVVLSLVHAGFYAARDGAMFLPHAQADLDLWIYVTAAEGMLFVFCDAFLIMSFVRFAREDLLSNEAYTDFLTGVLTRRRFFELAGNRLREHECCVLILDIDYFKSVNDTHGHAAGDEILCELGRVCRTALRQGDLVGRIGGDEFAVLIQDNEANALAVAHRIRDRFTLACRAQGYEVGLSVGVQLGHRVPVAALLDEADKQLYHAKQRRSWTALDAVEFTERRRMS